MRSPVHDPCSTMLPPVRNVRPVSPKCMLRQRIASDRLFCGSPRSLSQPSNCVSSVPPCGLTRAVMKVSGIPTTTQKPPELSAKVEANTGRPSYASTPSWMDTCQLTFPGCQLTWISPLFTTQFPLSSEPRKTLKPNMTFPFIGLSPSEYRGGCPPDVSSCRSALFGGSIRPPPVHFPVTHEGGGPAQKLGLCATEVSGVESWHAVATSAAAARLGAKRSIRFFSIAPPPRRVVSASATEEASRQDKCPTADRCGILCGRESCAKRVAGAARRHCINSGGILVARSPKRARDTSHFRRWISATGESAAGSGVRSAPRGALHLPCKHLLRYARLILRAQLAPSGIGIAAARRAGEAGDSAALSTSNRASSHTTATIRSAACPSHRSITGRAGQRRARARSAAASTASRRGSTSRLVPCVHVIGRSVLGRTVTHGTPRNVVSSWSPPESVTTSAEPATRLSISR